MKVKVKVEAEGRTGFFGKETLNLDLSLSLFLPRRRP